MMARVGVWEQHPRPAATPMLVMVISRPLGHLSCFSVRPSLPQSFMPHPVSLSSLVSPSIASLSPSLAPSSHVSQSLVLSLHLSFFLLRLPVSSSLPYSSYSLLPHLLPPSPFTPIFSPHCLWLPPSHHSRDSPSSYGVVAKQLRVVHARPHHLLPIACRLTFSLLVVAACEHEHQA